MKSPPVDRVSAPPVKAGAAWPGSWPARCHVPSGQGISMVAGALAKVWTTSSADLPSSLRRRTACQPVGMSPAWAEVSEDPTGAVFDDGRGLLIETHRFADGLPLRGVEFFDFAGQAHAAEEGGGQAVAQALRGIAAVQHGPDLRLARQDEPMEIGGDDRDFRDFVGVGKR